MHGPLRIDARIEERTLQGAQRVLEAGTPQAQIRSGGGGGESGDAQLRRAESRNLLAPGLRVVKSVVQVHHSGKAADAGEERRGHDLRPREDAAQQADDGQVAAVALLGGNRVPDSAGL